ncbi:MAG: hypothetical protein NT139_02720 [Candidatus Woesearchaeota archaeon]|nr:hypothetical protein [Candidatus Woesearchaeota archaeon]
MEQKNPTQIKFYKQPEIKRDSALTAAFSQIDYEINRDGTVQHLKSNLAQKVNQLYFK